MTHDANYRPLDPKSVARLAIDLYNLKHFDKMLENVKLTVAAAHEGTYRERPHHVHSKGSSDSWNPMGAIFGTQSPRGRVQVIAHSRYAQMGRGFASGTMRPNSLQEQARAHPHQMQVRAKPSPDPTSSSTSSHSNSDRHHSMREALHPSSRDGSTSDRHRCRQMTTS